MRGKMSENGDWMDGGGRGVVGAAFSMFLAVSGATACESSASPGSSSTDFTGDGERR